MARAAAIFGTSFEIIVPMTDTLSITDGSINLVSGESGLSGGKTLTLPAISQMVASQNEVLFVNNKSGSGGTITVAARGTDSIQGRVTCAVATGLILKHDGIKTWFGF